MATPNTPPYNPTSPIDRLDAGEYTDIQNNLESMSSFLNQIIKLEGKVGLEAKNIRKTITDQVKLYQNIVKFNSDFYSGVLKTKIIEADIRKIAQDRLYLEVQLRGAQTELLALQYADQLASLNTLEAQTIAIKDANIQVDKQLGLTGQLLAGINRFPVISEVLHIDDALIKMRQLAISGASTPQIMSKGLFTAFSPLLSELTLVAATIFAIKAAMVGDVQATGMAKQLGIAKDQAWALRSAFVSYSGSVDNSYITTTKLMEANTELGAQLGVVGKYSGKMADDFSRLTGLMGLSTEEAGKLATLSILNGKSISSTAKDIIKGSVAAGQSNKLSVDQREILKEVSTLSAGILVKFRENPVELGKAVVEAKALGLNLSEVDKIGDSMLDWESSIQNELKAELITGKQINLEKARYAALTGDQVTLMHEVAKQTGSIQDYQKMNVIAQKSLAEAFGLSRDELSKMLLDQDKFNRLGDVSKMTAQEQLELAKKKGISVQDALYQSLQQQSAQEKFNQAIEKLSDLLGNLLAGPIGKLVDGFAEVASNATAIKLAVGALAGFSLTKLIMGFASIATELGFSAAAALTTMSSLTLGIGVAAILAGMAAAIYAFKSEAASVHPGGSMNDGVIDPSGGMVVSGKKGSIQLHKDDSIIAGTNLGGSNGKTNDLEPLISAINEVKQAVNKLYNKQGNIYLDGKKVGTSLNIGSYKLA